MIQISLGVLLQEPDIAFLNHIWLGVAPLATRSVIQVVVDGLKGNHVSGFIS